MKSRFNKYLLSSCILFMSVIYTPLFSHNQNPPHPKTNPGPPPPGLPIDGGLSYLLISGIIYGVYELKRKK